MNQENRTVGSWFRQQKMLRMRQQPKKVNLASISKLAKEIRKKGESWKSAMKRAAKLYNH